MSQTELSIADKRRILDWVDSQPKPPSLQGTLDHVNRELGLRISSKTTIANIFKRKDKIRGLLTKKP